MSQPRSTSQAETRSGRWTPAALARVTFTLLAILVVEVVVCGAAAVIPGLLLYTAARAIAGQWIRVTVLAMAATPAYVLFALCLMLLSAASARLTGARTPPDRQLRIADMEWPLMQWVRYMAASHVVRVFAGSIFRGTPVWTLYLRLNGAQVGRRVYINSLSVSDHNLLAFGDDVVIGGDVHLSGHTVEGGFVKTGRVTIGPGVTIGLGSVIEIDVQVGARAQIGALGFVPKHARLEADGVYVGIPVKLLQPPAILGTK